MAAKIAATDEDSLTMFSFSKRGALKIGIVVALSLNQAACSFYETAQRINVDYNYTVEGITNELTLLNIVRAKDGLPLHYTSVQRLTGSITLKGTAGFNASVKSSAPNDNVSSQTAAGPTGTTLTNIVSRAVLSGGNVYTPSIGGEINTGPSFDVNILDTQTFYQGILAGVPFSIVIDFLRQGYENKWLMSLLIERVEFRLKQDTPGVAATKGDVLRVIRNRPGVETDPGFPKLLECYSLDPSNAKPKGTPIAPFSRVTSARDGRSLTLVDLALLDGAKLDLSAAISKNARDDVDVTVFRPAAPKDVARLTRSPDCSDPERTVNGKQVALPRTPPTEVPYVGSGQVMVLARDGGTGVLVDADISVTFRSPEGVIAFLGACLEAGQSGSTMACAVGGETLFVLHQGEASDALVSATLQGQRYFVANDRYRKPTMKVISLIERLVNLQKASTDRPVTVPVQVVP